ncbi:MAG: tRNA (5-methylaminomethyl-2-thiouridine)(34)-methyltransferase MnmD [Bacteroidales bacterium]
MIITHLHPQRRKIVTFDDGSKSLFWDEIGESYHSSQGSIEESKYVFIYNGLDTILEKRVGTSISDTDDTHVNTETINILEYGFGTGLNLILTLNRLIDASQTLLYPKKTLEINYESMDLYPLTEKEYTSLDYEKLSPYYIPIHKAPWNKTFTLAIPNKLILNNYSTIKVNIKKTLCDIRDFKGKLESVDLIYFDAFSPSNQPELWSPEIIYNAADNLKHGGLFTTYSARGILKTSLREKGLIVKRLKGFGKKHHMVNAYKN